MVELTELRSTALADGVKTSLLDHIRRSGLNPGDMLPKEKELSLQLSKRIRRLSYG